MTSFWERVDRSAGLDDCWPWTGGITGAGYGQLEVDGKRIYAHRQVFFFAHGYLPPVVRHACDNPPCCNPLHLLGGTYADNAQDMVARGRGTDNRGERNPGSRLRAWEIQEIRRLYAAGGITQTQISIRFGVSQVHVSSIINMRRWRHVPGGV